MPNIAPTIKLSSTQPSVWTEGKPFVIAPTIQLADRELDAKGSYEGATLKISTPSRWWGSFEGSDKLDFDWPNGTFSLSGQELGTFNVSVSSQAVSNQTALELKFTTGTTDQINEVSRSIAYVIDNKNPKKNADNKFLWEFSDGKDKASIESLFDVQAINDSPSIITDTAGTFTLPEVNGKYRRAVETNGKVFAFGTTFQLEEAGVEIGQQHSISTMIDSDGSTSTLVLTTDTTLEPFDAKLDTSDEATRIYVAGAVGSWANSTLERVPALFAIDTTTNRLDTSFSNDGIIKLTDLNINFDNGNWRAISVNPNGGSVTVAGFVRDGAGPSKAFVGVFDREGAVKAIRILDDPNSGGWRAYGVTNDGTTTAVAIQYWDAAQNKNSIRINEYISSKLEDGDISKVSPSKTIDLDLGVPMTPFGGLLKINNGYVLAVRTEISDAYVGALLKISNGALDSTFGNKGIALVDPFNLKKGSSSNIYEPTLTIDNEAIIVAGNAQSNDGNFSFVARVDLESGALDTSFGLSGFAKSAGWAGGVTQAQDGSIYLPVSRGSEQTYTSFALPQISKFDQFGNADTSFNPVASLSASSSEGVSLIHLVTLVDDELTFDDFSGVTVSIVRKSGANTFDDIFEGSDDVALSGGTIRLKGKALGSYTSLNGELTLRFNKPAQEAISTAEVSEVLSSIAYKYRGEWPDKDTTLPFVVRVSDGNQGSQGEGGARFAESEVSIALDTSTKPVVTVKASAKSFNEGDVATFTIEGVPNTTYSWNLTEENGGINGSDIGIAIEGTVLVNQDGLFHISVPLYNDKASELIETISLRIAGNDGSWAVAKANVIDSSFGTGGAFDHTTRLITERIETIGSFNGSAPKVDFPPPFNNLQSVLALDVSKLSGSEVLGGTSRPDENGGYNVGFVQLRIEGQKPTWEQIVRPTAGQATVLAAAFAPDDSIYVAGNFSGTLENPSTGERLSTGSPDNFHMFLSRYSIEGDLLWINDLGPSFENPIAEGGRIGLIVNTKGQAVVAAPVKGNDNYWDTELRYIGANGKQDAVKAFVVGESYNDKIITDLAQYSDGAIIGVGFVRDASKTIGLVQTMDRAGSKSGGVFGTHSPSLEVLTAVAVDHRDATYIAGMIGEGYLEPNYMGGPSPIVTDTDNSFAFVAKLNPLGKTSGDSQPQWITAIGGKNVFSSLAYDLVVSNYGEIFVGGTLLGGLDGGTNFGHSDAFISKLNANTGSILWSKQAGYDVKADDGSDAYTRIALTPDGKILVGGLTSTGNYDYVGEPPSFPQLITLFEEMSGSPVSVRIISVNGTEIKLGVYLNVGVSAKSVALNFITGDSNLNGLGTLQTTSVYKGWIVADNAQTGQIQFTGGTTSITGQAGGTQLAELSFQPSANQVPPKTFAIANLLIDGKLAQLPAAVTIPDRKLNVSLDYWTGGALSSNGVEIQVAQSKDNLLATRFDLESESYKLDGLARDSVELFVSNFADAKGAIDAEDGLLALKLAVGKYDDSKGSALDAYQRIAADVDGNKVIDVTDAFLILQQAATSNLSFVNQWLFLDKTKIGTSSSTGVPSFTPSIKADLKAADSSLELVAILKGDVSGLSFGSAPLVFEGTSSADQLDGNPANNVMDGLDGNDIINGKSGRDQIRGGRGTDILDGGAGDDTLRGGPGSDTFLVSSGKDVIFGDGSRAEESNNNMPIGDPFEGGYDTLSFTGSRSVAITITNSEFGSYKVTNSEGTGSGTFYGIERIVGTDGADFINADSYGDWFNYLSADWLDPYPSKEFFSSQGFGLALQLNGGSDKVIGPRFSNQPWAGGFYVDYGWSKSGISLTTNLDGRSMTVAYTKVADQAKGKDVLDNISSFRATKYDDVFDFRNLRENFLGISTTQRTKTAWAVVDLSDGGNDTILGNGDIIVNFGSVSDSSKLSGGRKQGIDFSLGFANSPKTIDLAYLKSNGGEAMGKVTYYGLMQVSGTPFDDTLRGGDRDDFEAFVGNGGNDVIIGGAGWDRAGYTGSNKHITVNLAEGEVYVFQGESVNQKESPHDDGVDTLEGVEEIRGSMGDDFFDARGFTGDPSSGNPNIGSEFYGKNTIIPEGGNDTIEGNGHTLLSYQNAMVGVNASLKPTDDGYSYAGVRLASDKASIYAASIGTDKFKGVYGLIGSANDDVLLGGGVGRQVGTTFGEYFYGGAGDDTIDGGGVGKLSHQIDFASYSASPNAIHVDLATGIAFDGFGTQDRLANIDIIIGSQHNDTILGGAGNDGLEGNGGIDFLDGAGGYNEVLFGNDRTGIIVALDKDKVSASFKQQALEKMGAAVGSSNFMIDTRSGSISQPSSGPLIDPYLTSPQNNPSLSFRLKTWFTDTNGDDKGRLTATLKIFDRNKTLITEQSYNFTKDLTKLNDSNPMFNQYGGYWTYFANNALNPTQESPLTTTINPTKTINFKNIGSIELSVNNRGLVELEELKLGDFKLVADAANNAKTVEGEVRPFWAFENNPATFLLPDLKRGLSYSFDEQSKRWSFDEIANFSGVEGSDYDDLIHGDDSDNRIDGRGGSDTIYGGNGNDWVEYNNTNQGVIVNLASNSASDDGYWPDTEDYLTIYIDELYDIENVQGGTGNDLITGDTKPNILVGEDGRDTLNGGEGDDTLLGGLGGDLMTGGQGNDIFYIEKGDTFLSPDPLTPWDKIFDFELGKDKIQLGSINGPGPEGTNLIGGQVVMEFKSFTDKTWNTIWTDFVNKDDFASTTSKVDVYFFSFTRTSGAKGAEVAGDYLVIAPIGGVKNGKEIVIEIVGASGITQEDFLLGPLLGI